MKKLTAFLLALCLMLPVLPAHASEEPPAWAAEAYAALDAREIPVPFGNGPVDRRGFVNLLVALLDKTVSPQALEAYPAPKAGYFADTGGTLSWDDCYRAAGYGILEGSLGGDGLRYLKGGDHLTREQGAKMLVSLLDFFSQKLGYTVKAEGSPAVYADAGKISAWALPSTQAIASYGLMKGDNFGNFNPQGELDCPSAVVMAFRTLELLDEAVNAAQGILTLQSQAYWPGAAQFGSGDASMARSQTGWASGYYTIANGDGTVSGLTVSYDAITVERFNADGSLASSKTVERELLGFGAFLDAGDRFYLAFGQGINEEKDDQEVWRIVQYDRDWNRLGSASVNAGDSYTTGPFNSTVSRMAVSADGKTLALHAARQRYTSDDGLRHQSNITITVNTADMKVLSVSEPFPGNHVSHSFGQFARFDGDELVTVDHGDAFPRAFVLHDDAQEAELLKIAGNIGNNVTNAIGSGLEISEDNYLFLGCSDPQDGTRGPWNVFLTCTAKESKELTPPWPEGSTNTSLTILPGGTKYQATWKDPDGKMTHWVTNLINEDLSTTTLTWLTHSDTTIDCARLVKLDKNTFVAMWQAGEDILCQKLDGKGQLVGQEQVFPNALMPPTDPVVMDGDICWIQYSVPRKSVFLYRLEVQ